MLLAYLQVKRSKLGPCTVLGLEKSTHGQRTNVGMGYQKYRYWQTNSIWCDGDS